METPIIAMLGLVGWHEYGVWSHGTYSKDVSSESELKAPIRVDLRPVLDCDNPVAKVWARPVLDLSLPKDNVRNLLEGCIGNEGSVDGHLWAGEEIRPTDSVGLNVYLHFLRAQGAIITGA